MKKLVVALALSLSLGACAQLQSLDQAFQFATVGVNNPITKDTLYNLENAMTVAFAGLAAYKKACAQGAADKNCKGNIKAIQAYTSQLPGLLASLRKFVKNNDQVNAQVVYSTIQDLVSKFKVIAAQNGITTGG